MMYKYRDVWIQTPRSLATLRKVTLQEYPWYKQILFSFG